MIASTKVCGNMSCFDNKTLIISGITVALVYLLLSYLSGNFNWLIAVLMGVTWVLVGIAVRKLKGGLDRC